MVPLEFDPSREFSPHRLFVVTLLAAAVGV